MQTRFLNMKDLGNGITTVGNREDTFELSTEKLNKVRKDEPKLDKIAQDLWRKDSKNVWYASIFYEKFLHEMNDYVVAELDRLYPDTIRPCVYYSDRCFQAEHVRKSGRYFFILLAMDYLSILDDFIKEHQIDFDETSEERKERLSGWNY